VGYGHNIRATCAISLNDQTSTSEEAFEMSWRPLHHLPMHVINRFLIRHHMPFCFSLSFLSSHRFLHMTLLIFKVASQFVFPSDLIPFFYCYFFVLGSFVKFWFFLDFIIQSQFILCCFFLFDPYYFDF
jgi:hypothetical protein